MSAKAQENVNDWTGGFYEFLDRLEKNSTTNREDHGWTANQKEDRCAGTLSIRYRLKLSQL
jgi:hypothetical protein